VSPINAKGLSRYGLTIPNCSLREIVGDYGSLPLYHMLGYFSLIGLLRVHVLLGDFTLALKVVENVELNQKVRGISPKWVSACCDLMPVHLVYS
jgi:hypothetical protein